MCANAIRSRVSPAYGVDDDSLFRTTTDLPAAFAAMAGPATFSTVYTAADKGGITMSCENAWDHISTRLAEPGLFDAYVRQACIRTGFDVGNAAQLARCKSQLGEMGQMMMGTPLSMQAFLTDVMLGTSVGDVLFEDSPATAARVMANRAVISNGLATMSAANEWMPTIRATVFGIMLFMVPVALLFVLTPINLRVLSYALGLFVFVALWGVIDAGIYQLTLGRAMDVLGEMRANHLAANAWMLAPSSAMKALGVFGTYRLAAAGLAGAFVFTVFRFSGNVFSALTGASTGIHAQASGAAAPLATSEGYASALEAQGAALGTAQRRAVSSRFADFGERTSFAAFRSFGEASTIIGEGGGMPGQAGLSLGALDGERALGAIAPALGTGPLGTPQAAKAVRANATTAAIHQFAEKDALRGLGTRYFGEGQRGEQAFAAFAQTMVQWKAFGDQRAYAMMQQSAARHFERSGYNGQDAELKAASVIAEASADPTFAKLIANAWDQEQMLRNDLTGAQVQAGAMEGRRDFAGADVAGIERRNVSSEQAHRTGANDGQRDAADMLGVPLQEASRRIAFINTLSGEARSSAITQLARATGRNEAQVESALATYSASSQLGTADGATAEAAREGTSVYGRARETAGYDFAERAGKLDAQREVGLDGTRDAARIGEQRRQSDNFGFAQGAAAAGVSTREAARLDSFIRTLADTSGNQVDLAEGGAAGIADRARNARLTSIVDRERLSRMQGLLRANGIELSMREIAMDQNGDFGLNLTPQTAAQMSKAGLLNESQLGAVANGGHARFSLAHNDLLVSSSAGFEKSARNDTSTRFEAGKQAGPDTIEHFMGGGAEGQAALANWLRGSFEMDRKGHWRLKPQVADTLQRDVQAIMAQTGWQRTVARNAQDQNSFTVSVDGQVGGSVEHRSRTSKGQQSRTSGTAGGSLSVSSSEIGNTSETAIANLDIMNFEVRQAISNAEWSAARLTSPHRAFSIELSKQVFGNDGLRNRYLQNADDARGTLDINAPITSLEQSSLLTRGRFSNDPAGGPSDGKASPNADD
jgi:conjugal transfer mating pair stabilization protein TraG